MELRPPAPTPVALQPAVAAFEDAHQLWHDAAETYHEPQTFRRHVESLIQALRNVTFRLQASKGKLPGFDAWYGPWQELMRADEGLRWLIDARNDIVKHTGLKTDSYAMVSRITSYLEPDRVLLKLAAGTPTAQVVDRARASLPEQYRQHMAVSLVRRWAVPGRSQDEVLTLLAQCLHILDALLLYAGDVVAGCEAGSPSAFLATVQRPSCMLVSPAMIPRYFEADTGEEFYVARKQALAGRDLAPIIERYGETALAAVLSHDPLERARQLHSMARTLFKRDGHHIPLAYLRHPDGKWELIVVWAEDKRDKFLMWHAIGARVAAEGNDAVIFTSEVWMADRSWAPVPYPDLSTVQGRQEAVVTWTETFDGRGETITSPIVRNLGKAYLKPLIRRCITHDSEPGFMAPIRRAWRDRRASAGYRPSQAEHETRRHGGA